MGPLVRAGTAGVRLASRLRGERAIHARGRTLTGRLVLPGGAGTGAPLLDEPGAYDVVVRLSRSLGLPPSWPDVLGLAVRVVDAHGPGRHQDLLMDSTRAAPLLRRLPLPAHDHLGVLHGSLLPYAVAGRHLLLGARGAGGSAGTLEELVETAFDLLVATPHGPWRTVGRLRTDAERPAPHGRQVRFNPATTGGGIGLAGPLQSWRARAYPASQEVG